MKPKLQRLDRLRPWDRNYNVGDIAAIAQSIELFGFNSVLATFGDQVMVGNHRYHALNQIKAAGKPAPSGITVTKGNVWNVPTVPLDHLTEDQATAYAIADNKTASLATPDDKLLAELMLELEETDLLPATGYKQTEIDDLIAALDQSSEQSQQAKAETTSPLPVLKWNKNTCTMTIEEADELTRRFEAHIESRGTPFGFVKAILGI